MGDWTDSVASIAKAGKAEGSTPQDYGVDSRAELQESEPTSWDVTVGDDGTWIAEPVA
jgi:hypothetical protein